MQVKTTGLVIAAGSSKRLGQPKQLLPYKGATLLEAALAIARQAPFDQRILTLGDTASQLQQQLDLSGFEIIHSSNPKQGCSSSIVSAMSAITSDTTGIVLLLGDQPEISTEAIEEIIATGNDTKADIVTCNYDDGIGHPFWFNSSMFDSLAALRGDKAVWKLIESAQHEHYELYQLSVAGSVPLDVDTWQDYEALLNQQRNTSESTTDTTTSHK